jgi:hypothetical protein
MSCSSGNALATSSRRWKRRHTQRVEVGDQVSRREKAERKTAKAEKSSMLISREKAAKAASKSRSRKHKEDGEEVRRQEER